MKKFMIILNAVYYNRGSEALARSIAAICRKKYPDCDITLVSSEVDFEKSQLIEGIDHNIRRYGYVSKYSAVNLYAVFQRFVMKNVEKATYIRCKKVIDQAKKMDCVVVVGGDNYDQSYGLYYILHSLNLALRKAEVKKLVLYDCSLEEKDIDNSVIEDFKLFDAISARESLTYNNFKKFIGENLYFYPDPAFIMKSDKLALPKGWKDNQMIGINVSNLVVSGKYGVSEEQILTAYKNMICYLIRETSYCIILIPHVMDGADLSILKKLYEEFRTTGRVRIIKNEQLTAPQLKYIISKCRFLVTARTHASIAAYSTGVPALVLGYSIKSVGIATDLFGKSDHYVIPTYNLKNPDALVDGVQWLIAHENQIRKRLNKYMPSYLEKTWGSIELFE